MKKKKEEAFQWALNDTLWLWESGKASSKKHHGSLVLKNLPIGSLKLSFIISIDF